MLAGMPYWGGSHEGKSFFITHHHGKLHQKHISRACEALGFEKHRFVGDRIPFFSSTRCLSDFRESANSRRPQQRVD